MAKTRLRNDDREAIRNAIISHKFKPLEAALAAEANALAIKVRAKAYGPFAKTIDSAPEGAFPTKRTFHVNVGGKKIGVEADGQMRCFHAHYYGSDPLLAVTDADPLGAAVMDWATRKEALTAERDTLREQVRGTLAAFNTFDDLQRDWPEADRFIVARWQTRPEYAANVPAVQIASLTVALDLPPDEQAEAA